MRSWVTLGTAAAILGLGVVAGAQNLTVKGTIVGEQGNYFATVGGNVGIGTTSPVHKLQVAGNIGATSAYLSTLNTNGRGQTDWYNINTGSIGAWQSIYSYGSICTGNNNGDCTGPGGTVVGITNPAAANNIPNGGNVFFNGGNVGVGTSNPQSKLHILTGGTSTTADLRLESPHPTMRFEDTDGSTYWLHANDNRFYLLWDAGLNGGWMNPHPLYFDGRTAYFNEGTLVVNAGLDRVGVRVNSPAYRLHVAGDILADGGWLRVSGTQGIYWETYGGGWYMSDTTWVRAYNGKSIHTPATVQADGRVNTAYLYSWGNAQVDGSLGVNGNATVGGTATINGSLNLYGYLRGNNYGFGGMYRSRSDNTCPVTNPYTGGCSCPAGTWATAVFTGDVYEGPPDYPTHYTTSLYWCVR
ncbi:MAG TPA: shufflon system plasmid conjugative transfer pilus tip adhesin PilV [Polyangia bacterium]